MHFHLSDDGKKREEEKKNIKQKETVESYEENHNFS